MGGVGRKQKAKNVVFLCRAIPRTMPVFDSKAEEFESMSFNR